MGGAKRRRGQDVAGALPPPPVGDGFAPVVDAYPGGTNWQGLQNGDPGGEPGGAPGWEPDGAPNGDPSPPPRRWRRIGTVVRVGILVAVAGSALAGWLGMADRDDDGAITKAGDLAATELRVGDCLDDPGTTQVTDIRAVLCDEPHDLEVYHEFEHADAERPPFRPEALSVIELECVPAFDAFVGVPYIDSELDFFTFEPTTQGWQEGDRTVQCALYALDGSKLTGSARGAQR